MSTTQLSAEWQQKIEREAEFYANVGPDDAEISWGAGAKYYAIQLVAAQERIKTLEAALTIVVKWELPPTGRFWDDNVTPMSFGACYGSNGERDFMRHVANEALLPNTVKDKEDEKETRMDGKG